MSRKAIVYYSYGNNTRSIVEEMLKSFDADVFEIKPKTPFTTNYQVLVDNEERKQHDDEIIEITYNKFKPKDYDVIVLGTPVWWYTMSSPIRSFLNENDLSGKTIVPFATNGGWLGHTFEDIRKYAKGATVKSPLSIKFNEDKLDTNIVGITDWIDSIIDIM